MTAPPWLDCASRVSPGRPPVAVKVTKMFGALLPEQSEVHEIAVWAQRHERTVVTAASDGGLCQEASAKACAVLSLAVAPTFM